MFCRQPTVALITQNLSDLERLCRRFHVARLELFGSAATGDFDAGHSDLDFLVRFQQPLPLRLSDQHFGLTDGLEALFGCKVDLVMERALKNPYFIEGVNESRELLYAA